ncbi:AraC family transcriptional regulator [Microvirga aerophila]|uniref:AraC family transcriptional regulator n=1 Tax=Microvirga aerophila TaxID=670291 RepID=A0A512C0V5_9HYPH|nr:AraC family transcriptional regulator [Microvirga aerophila]
MSVPEITVSSSESRYKVGRLGAKGAAATRIDLEETDMEPDLEVVQIRPGESFAAWSHGYPYRTVRWHFHPEYELHQVVATKGRYFVGDFIGEFEPGNLVLTGPNLPHNWVSDVPKDIVVPLRCRIIQFSEGFISGVMTALPELAALGPVLELSRRGVLFSRETSHEIADLMSEVMDAQGVRRIELFMSIAGLLSRAKGLRMLASASYLPDPSGYMSVGINKALAFIRENLTQPFDEADLAAIAGQSTNSFSRAFRQHTGMSLVQYVKRLRINLACQILMSDEQASITSICYEVGYNNLSNFNRQFLAEKGMTPSRFRRLLLDNSNTAKLVKGGARKYHLNQREKDRASHGGSREEVLC